MRIAPAVILNEDDRRKLQSLARGRSLPARLVERAQIVLLAAQGKQNLEIAQQLSTAPRTVAVGAIVFCGLGWRAWKRAPLARDALPS